MNEAGTAKSRIEKSRAFENKPQFFARCVSWQVAHVQALGNFDFRCTYRRFCFTGASFDRCRARIHRDKHPVRKLSRWRCALR